MADTTVHLQAVLDRLRAGDPAARAEVIERAYARFRRLAAVVIRQSFPRMAAHDETVLQETALRVFKALDAVEPETPADLYRLAAHKVRQVLLDLVGKARRPAAGVPEGDDSGDPVRLAQWTEFHDRADRLPADERRVFELCYYAGLSQREAADLLGEHPRKVSRLWVTATERLLDAFPDARDGIPG